MFLDENFIHENTFVPQESKFLKKYNNIYITDEQVGILKKYNIDVNMYTSLDELIYDIEEYLNNSLEDNNDLDYVSQCLSEYKYYNNTNK